MHLSLLVLSLILRKVLNYLEKKNMILFFRGPAFINLYGKIIEINIFQLITTQEKEV